MHVDFCEQNFEPDARTALKDFGDVFGFAWMLRCFCLLLLDNYDFESLYLLELCFSIVHSVSFYYYTLNHLHAAGAITRVCLIMAIKIHVH